MLSIIVAADINYGIGKDNKLLFHIKEDMKRFKELTINHTIIMGRKTFESLPNGILPNRQNIVLTTSNRINTISPTESLIFKNNIDELIYRYKDSEEEVFVIGGGFVFNEFLPYCNKIYLTKINKECENVDTYFKFDEKEWVVDSIENKSSEQIEYAFINLIKKSL